MKIQSRLLIAVIALAFSAVAMAQEDGSTDYSTATNPALDHVDNVLQADPKTVLRMRKKIQEFAAAKNAPIVDNFDDIPQEVLDIEEIYDVSLEPGAPAPTIFIARYQSSAVSFVDAYGNPWPIRKISSFLSKMILIDRATPSISEGSTDEEKKSEKKKPTGIPLNDPQAGSFSVTALKHGVTGNLTIYLEGLATPISILLVGKSAMYNRMSTIRINDVGPQSNQTDILSAPSVAIGAEADTDLNNALYGVSPSGSEEMVVAGGEGKAWLKGAYLFLQTPIAVFSPQIQRTSPGNGKYRAYKLPATTEVLGTNTEGRTISLKIMRQAAVSIENDTYFKGGK